MSKLRDVIKGHDYVVNSQGESWECDELLNDPHSQEWLCEEVCQNIENGPWYVIDDNGFETGEYYTLHDDEV